MDISNKIKLIRRVLQKTSDNNLDDVLEKIEEYRLKKDVYVIRKNLDEKIIEYIIVDKKKMFYRYVYGEEYYYYLKPIEDWDLSDGKKYDIDREDSIYILQY
jgi:hypothetical protein